TELAGGFVLRVERARPLGLAEGPCPILLLEQLDTTFEALPDLASETSLAFQRDLTGGRGRDRVGNPPGPPLGRLQPWPPTEGVGESLVLHFLLCRRQLGRDSLLPLAPLGFAPPLLQLTLPGVDGINRPRFDGNRLGNTRTECQRLVACGDGLRQVASVEA